MASGDGSDVFVSYARSDGDAAAELNGWLVGQKFSTFFDRYALRRLRWVPALEEAIGRSKAAATLIGPQGIGNPQQTGMAKSASVDSATRHRPYSGYD
jgi:hypothetical protein